MAGGLQNRVLHSSVLLEGSRTHRVPVSCVEQGRWRPAGLYGEMFGLVDRCADPYLRGLVA